MSKKNTNIEDKRMLWSTNVGSHVWLMDRPGSDIDLFNVYIVPTKDILSGKNRGHGSHFSGGPECTVDKASHEIGKVITELIDGNINFLVGTLSSIIVHQYKNYLPSLREIVIEHGQSKACTHSIRGLAYKNYKKYVVGSDTAREYPIEKKCNSINRVLLFGINLLNGNGFEFKPVKSQTPEDVRNLMEEFEKTILESKLPEKNSPEPYQDYLLDIRIKELQGTL